MFYVSEPMTTPPESFKTPLQEKVYETLAALSMPYYRVDNDEAITMEDCVAIDAALDVKVVKSLLLTNRQQTRFYLFVTPGDKPFRSKDFGAAMEVSRVSFAPAERLNELIGTTVGAVTVFGTLLDGEDRIEVVIDEDVLTEEWYGCTDGTTTGYMKVKTEDVLKKFLPHAKHTYRTIRV